MNAAAVAPRVRRVFDRWSAAVAEAAALGGRSVRVDPAWLDRSGDLALGPPGLWSPNGSSRMVRAADGWLAVSLARPQDREMVPAWLERPIVAETPWPTIVATARRRPVASLLAQAKLLGLAVSIVGEVDRDGPPVESQGLGAPRPKSDRLRVTDLSSLWAGPLCAALLVNAGADVTRYESTTRAHPSRTVTPGFYNRLNARKAHVVLDFSSPADRARLREAMVCADVVVTSARPRALAALDLTPEAVFRENPGLTWVAITGHGWSGDAGERIGFGDDAAAAGGLVRWTPGKRPRFLGDALADPLTGLAAAAATFQALAAGGGVLLDAALARAAAAAALSSGRPADGSDALDDHRRRHAARRA